jgi:AraC-like DNA-binding protein
MDIFGEGTRHFWLSDLDSLLERFPNLEFPHKQNFYSLLFVVHATGVIEIDHQSFKIDCGCSLIIKPRCISSIQLSKKAKGKIICFTEEFFSLRYNNNILYQFSFLQQQALPILRLNAQQVEKCMLLIGLLSEEFGLKKRETQKVLRSYLNILLYEFERMYNPNGVKRAKNVKQEKIREFELLIDRYFDKKKLPSDYAEIIHISPNYLNKICKEETGQTAGEMIRKRVIIEAQRLLHYTNYSVNEIAEKLGFDSVSYFVTFFKKTTRTTPEKSRKLEV